jgi:hypothetical protein
MLGFQEGGREEEKREREINMYVCKRKIKKFFLLRSSYKWILFLTEIAHVENFYADIKKYLALFA